MRPCLRKKDKQTKNHKFTVTEYGVMLYDSTGKPGRQGDLPEEEAVATT